MHKKRLFLPFLFAALLGAVLHLAAAPVTRSDIQLLYATFDPVQDGEPAIPLPLQAAPTTPLVLIQLQTTPDAAMISGLQGLGLQLISFIPENTYLADLNGVSRTAVAAHPGVRWVGSFHPAYKLAPDAVAGPLLVQLFPDANVAATAVALTTLGVTVTAQTPAAQLLAVAAEAALLTPIAQLEAVRWLQADTPAQELNDDARWVSQANWRGHIPLTDRGLTGAGQVGAVADSGLAVYDFGDGSVPHCFFVDDSGGTAVVPNLSHRKVISYLVPPGAVGDFTDGSGHGSHVAGSVVGDGGIWGTLDVADGQAFAARLLFQDVGTGDIVGQIEPPDDYRVMFAQAYDPDGDGLYQPASEPRTHSNSYGSPSPIYSVESGQTDDFMWNHPDFLILYAAGNQGPAASTIGYPASAKNILTVGATENGFANPDNLLYASSHGPVPVGRLKPEVVAPGDRIVSAARGTACGTAEKSGTSMATPTVQGLALLLRQYLWDGYYPTGQPDIADRIHPSAALLKALLINSGRPVSGNHSDNGAGGSWPSNGQGWGRVTLADVVYFPGDRRAVWLQDEWGGAGFSAVNETRQFTLTVGSTEPLKVTLAWSDYPGAPVASGALVNNLNLQVMAPDGTVFTGNDVASNDFRGTPDLPAVMPDGVNPWEVVYREQPAAGVYTVTITAAALPSLAFSPAPQGYGLVVTGDLPDQRPQPVAEPVLTDNPLTFIPPPAMQVAALISTTNSYTLTWTAPGETADLTHYVLQQTRVFTRPLFDTAEGNISTQWTTGSVLNPWTSSPTYAQSGLMSYWSGRGDAGALVDTSLTLLDPVLLPTVANQAELIFHSRYFNDFNDYGHIEIQRNGGSWTPLRQLYADPRVPPTDGVLRPHQFDLTPYRGDSLRVRFRYDNGVFSQAPDSPGWWLDDIGLQAGLWQTAAVITVTDGSPVYRQWDVAQQFPGTDYYRVKAVYADGRATVWSPVLAVTAPAVPTQVGMLPPTAASEPEFISFWSWLVLGGAALWWLARRRLD